MYILLEIFWITETDPKEYLTEAGSAFSKAETHWFENEDQTKKQKGVLAYHDGRKELVISFRGSVVAEDWLVNLALKLVDGEVGKHKSYNNEQFLGFCILGQFELEIRSSNLIKTQGNDALLPRGFQDNVNYWPKSED